MYLDASSLSQFLILVGGDVSINDFASLDTSNNQITIGLNTGAKVQINSAENVSAKITMSEGSVNFNHSTGQWNLT